MRARKHHSLTRKQSPLEIIARDTNWQRGQIIALENHMQRVVHAVAPQSDALVGVAAGMARALLKHLEEREVSARSHHYEMERKHCLTPLLGNFISRSRS